MELHIAHSDRNNRTDINRDRSGDSNRNKRKDMEQGQERAPDQMNYY